MGAIVPAMKLFIASDLHGEAWSHGYNVPEVLDFDVAVGSRFVSGDGYAAYRYRPSTARAFGTALLRRAMKLVLGRPFADAK